MTFSKQARECAWVEVHLGARLEGRDLRIEKNSSLEKWCSTELCCDPMLSLSSFIKTLEIEERIYLLSLEIILSWERLQVCGKIELEFKISLTSWKHDLNEDKKQFGRNSLAGIINGTDTS